MSIPVPRDTEKEITTTEIMRHCHGNHPLQLALPPLLPGSRDPPWSCEAGFVEGRKNQIPKKLKYRLENSGDLDSNPASASFFSCFAVLKPTNHPVE